MTSQGPQLRYTTYEPEQEAHREALCALANGYLGTRGAAPERVGGTAGYPGSYIAGVFDRLVTEIAGRPLENESMVNIPDWLPLDFRINGEEWFSLDAVEIIDFEQILHIREALLERRVRFRDAAERETTVTQRRLVHLGRPHVAAHSTVIRAENWEGDITIRSWIDASTQNRGVDRYRDLRGDHLEIIGRWDEPLPMVRARTKQSRVEIVVATRTRLWHGGALVDVEPVPLGLEHGAGVELALSVSDELRIEKVAAIHTSRDRAITEPATACIQTLEQVGDMAQLEAEHVQAWRAVWRRFDISVDTDERTAMIVDLHLLHLLQTTSENTIDLDVGIPARGLHGEAYRGHIFWDELFMFPVLDSRVPEIARSLLHYRYRRLDAARRMARERGRPGAMYPWQSGSDGREESQSMHLNPRSGRWVPDETHRQRHIGIAVALNLWRYYETSGDVEFLARYGAEMMIEIARFFAAIATVDHRDGRYDIVGVVGPDEFHTSDPNWDGHGLRNNAYTNMMASWVLQKAGEALDPLPSLHRDRVIERLALVPDELEQWDHISRRLRVPTHDGVISQFQGYEDLHEFDWDGYRQRYGDIHRLDRILEAEGDDVNRYKASKQADVLMLPYLLSYEELVELGAHMGVEIDDEFLARTIDYYLARTSHGSTLSRVVHSWVLARSDRRRSMELFCEALESDIGDIQGGTTSEGIHLGAMAGTVDLLIRGYSGMEVRGGTLMFKPSLPPEIRRLAFRVYIRERWLNVAMTDGRLQLTSEASDRPPIVVDFRGERRHLAPGDSLVFERS